MTRTMTRVAQRIVLAVLLGAAFVSPLNAQEVVWSPAGEEVLATTNPLPATDPGAVQVFVDGHPANAYRELGTVSLTTWSDCDPEVVETLFKRKAAEVGGDGVIYLDMEAGAISCDLITGEVFEEKIYRGTVIKYE